MFVGKVARLPTVTVTVTSIFDRFLLNYISFSRMGINKFSAL